MLSGHWGESIQLLSEVQLCDSVFNHPSHWYSVSCKQSLAGKLIYHFHMIHIYVLCCVSTQSLGLQGPPTHLFLTRNIFLKNPLIFPPNPILEQSDSKSRNFPGMLQTQRTNLFCASQLGDQTGTWILYQDGQVMMNNLDYWLMLLSQPQDKMLISKVSKYWEWI